MANVKQFPSWRRGLYGLAVLGVAVGLAAAPAGAQVLYGSLVGTVSDQSGAMIPGATLTIVNKATGQSRTASTNEAGAYALENILAGTYDIEFSAAGFRTILRVGVEVTVNSVRRLNVQMEVGQVTEQVTVVGDAIALQTEKADVSAEIPEKVVKNLPLPNYRNYQSLLNLVPGATPGDFQNAAISRPGRALTTNVNGTNRNNNTTKLDGALNLTIWLPHHVAYVAPSETIETVNISTNNFDAEQGMAGGAAVTVVTKSGTNQLHGSLFAYHDNQRLRARNFFLRTPGKPKSIRNFDGFTVGGPIRKNKLFFFAGWEATRERTNRSGLFTIPTEDQRQGNFSAYNTTIYDPATGSADGRGRTEFPNNIVPAARQSSIARRIQDLLPLPNQPGVTGNYSNSGTQQLDRDQFDVKMNWNRSDTHSVWWKYSAMNAPVHCNAALGAAGGPGLCDAGSGEGANLTQLATIGHTWTLSPKMVVDGTVGYTRGAVSVTPPSYGTNYGLDWGIPGTNGPDVRQSGMPRFSVIGYTNIGDSDPWNPAFHRDQSYTGTTNLGWSRGKHSLRFGFETVRHQLNHWQPELGGGPRGALTFAAGVTGLNGGRATNQYNSYAAFLLGLPSNLQKSVQWQIMTVREWQFGWYLRDRWQATPNTTVILGLRYELFPLATRANSGLEFWDPETNMVTVGRRGGNPDNLGIEVSKKLFAPRFGLTRRLTPKTVLRTGYGITYNPLALARPLRGFYPLTIAAEFVGANTYQPVAPLQAGIPDFSGPDPNLGSIPLPGTVAMRTLWNPEGRDLNRGYIQSWNFMLERELPSNFVVSTGYVGTRTVRSFAYRDGNASAPGTGTGGSPFNVKYGRTASTELWNGFADANYHAWQTSVNRRFISGLLIKGAYTWSKAINMTDDDGWAGFTWNSPSVMGRNRALAGYDIPHNLQLGFVYELPLGRGKRFAADGVASKLLGGWQLNGIFASYSGRPYTVSATATSLNSRFNAQTADQVKSEVNKIGGIGPGQYFYDPTAFAPVTEVRFGTTGRNILRRPGAVNLDGSLFRSFRVSERIKLELRTEAFNVTNTPHFGAPGSNVSASSFMQVTSAAPDERQFRFGLRMEF